MKNYFFTDVTDIQTELGVSTNFRVQDLQPTLQRTVNKYFRNDYGIGKAFCDTILTNYNTGYDSLITIKKDLVTAIRNPLANLAFYHYIPVARLNFDKDGASESDQNKNLRMWVSDQAREEFLDAGFEGMEILLEFLEDNKGNAEFAAWASSNAYTTFKECFINTVSDFNREYPLLQSRRTFLAVRHIMRRVEEHLIKKTLGATIYDALKLKNKNNTALDNTEKNYMLSIKPAVAHLTMYDAFRELSVRINSKGLQVFSTAVNTENTNESKPADGSTLTKLEETAEQKGAMFLMELYLKVNPTASTVRDAALGNKIENKFFRL